MHLTSILKKPLAFAVITVTIVAGSASSVLPASTASEAEQIAADLGIHGGLCVQVGDQESSPAVPLAETGRFLVHVILSSDEAIQEARGALSDRGLYGLASVDRLGPGDKLPYTENLVNLLVVCDAPAAPVPLEEAKRVLAPGGILLAASSLGSVVALEAAGFADARGIQRAGSWIAGRKPRPAEMDDWGHPRHAAGGNPVSGDVLVAPPRRVRWVVGAQEEVPGIVTSAGRNFYGAALARDGFNGLRLWSRDLVDPASSGPFVLKRVPGDRPAPVAAGRYVFASAGEKLVALDAATGQTVREYPAVAKPRHVFHEQGTLIVVDAAAVYAIDVESGQLFWQYDADEPRCVVAGEDCVALIQGHSRRGEKAVLVLLCKTSGSVRWQRDDLPWAAKVVTCVYHEGMLACEVSSLNDDGPGNSLHLLSAGDGKLLWERDFLPGMNHRRQARAMFIGDRLWILHGGKDADKKPLPIECSALDPRTGETLTTHKAGLTHCFPPVATPRYLLAGELDMTDLATGLVDANRITKAACSADHGWVPANGLVYVTPKHCVCWPMLRGYAALAPEWPGGNASGGSVAEIVADRVARRDFILERGVDPPAADALATDEGAWPCYRHDAWRSAGTTSQGPAEPETLWTADLGGRPDGPIADDWRENPFAKGPVTAPVVAGGLVYVARPDAHEVLAVDVSTGRVRWRFTANGRVDTAPTVHHGLCLFGAKSGWVYCLRADDGRMVWRLRAAALDERIVAYGQLESPWPVPGSVLVVDDVAYFAAGRQPFADGGILVFAVNPADGAIRWVRRHDTVPQEGFYECSALEHDNFDLLHRQGDGVAMSRWVFDRATGEMSIERWDAFARLDTGGGAAMVPQGCWSYAPRHQRRISSFTHHRPLVVFRDNRLWGVMQGMQSVYRRDFDLDGGEIFNAKWMTGWAASGESRAGRMPWRSHRLAEKASWQVDLADGDGHRQTVAAMVLAGDRLWMAGSEGDLRALSADDGRQLLTRKIPAPLWDGMAVAGGRLFVSTADGRLLCLGDE